LSAEPKSTNEPIDLPERATQGGVLEILRRLHSGDIRPNDISADERRTCVCYLRLEGYTQEEAADVFAVCRQTIGRDEHVIREESAKLVDDLDVRSVAGGLIRWSQHLTAKALKNENYWLAWRIQRELLADLQGLGYLPKAVEQHQVQLATFADLARLADAGKEAEAPQIGALAADQNAEADARER
jgi:hypothetical protein